jgi:hypothetical protein
VIGGRAPASRAAAVLVVLAALVTRASASRANGRYPAAGQLVVDPTDGSHIVALTTFGLLQSLDAGLTWAWLCERAISPEGFQDPEVGIIRGGRTVVGLPDGLALGERAGCQWTRVPELAGDEVIDLVVSGGDPAIAYTATVARVDGAFNGLIAATTDGVSWSTRGALLSDTYPLTIEIAPSRPQRLYLGANDSNLETGFIDVSDDGGGTWAVHDSPGGVDSVYVSAIDPDDADRVYVRSYSPQSNLYVSEDGARTWTVILESPVPQLGFALSPDGRQLAAGGKLGVTILARTDGGAGSVYAVAATNPLPVSCLTWTTGGLFACADEASAGFTIGVSIDAGRTFASMLRLADLKPVSCATGTSAASCAGEWCATASIIGAACSTPVDAATDAAGDGRRPASTPAAGCACDASAGPAPLAAVPLVMILIPVVAGRSRHLSARASRHRLPLERPPPPSKKQEPP